MTIPATAFLTEPKPLSQQPIVTCNTSPSCKRGGKRSVRHIQQSRDRSLNGAGSEKHLSLIYSARSPVNMTRILQLSPSGNSPRTQAQYLLMWNLHCLLSSCKVHKEMLEHRRAEVLDGLKCHNLVGQHLPHGRPISMQRVTERQLGANSTFIVQTSCQYGS